MQNIKKTVFNQYHQAIHFNTLFSILLGPLHSVYSNSYSTFQQIIKVYQSESLHSKFNQIYSYHTEKNWQPCSKVPVIFFKISSAIFQTYILLWCYLCGKLETKWILVLRNVSTINWSKKNEEDRPVSSEISENNGGGVTKIGTRFILSFESMNNRRLQEQNAHKNVILPVS